MPEMRQWLDRTGLKPDVFEYRRMDAHGVVCRVDFKVATEAAAFAEAIEGNVVGRSRDPLGDSRMRYLLIGIVAVAASAISGPALPQAPAPAGRQRLIIAPIEAIISLLRRLRMRTGRG